MMEKKIHEFVELISEHYGRPGLVVSLLIIFSVLALIFFFLNRPPKNK